jgi:flagellar biosynthesis anti-sigma factor FlgM
MRIPDSYTRLGVNAPQAAQKVSSIKSPAAEGAATAPTEDVRVQVSARGRELSLKSDREVDSARVERLKASIESGEFKVDARRIADRMIQGG